MKRMRMLVVVALALVICLPGMAMAVTSIGVPYADWAQAMNESGVGNFDNMEAFMTSGGSVWTSTGFSNFGDASWTGAKISSTYTKASGNALANLNFDLSGTDVGPPNIFTYDFLAYTGGGYGIGTLAEAAHASYNEGAWSFTVFTSTANPGAYDRSSSSPVPIPPSALLMGSGLLGLVGLGWRRRKVS